MSSQIFFKDGGYGLSSIKSTSAGDGVVTTDTGDGNGDGSVGASTSGDGSVSDAATENWSVASAAGDGSVDAATGDGSAVGRTGVSGRLRIGVDGALRL